MDYILGCATIIVVCVTIIIQPKAAVAVLPALFFCLLYLSIR